MSPEEKYGLFEDYLNSELPEAQRSEFERSLSEDAALKEEFELYREARTSITSRLQWEGRERQFRQTLESLSEKHFQSQSTARVVPLSRRRWILTAVGAAAVILLMLFVWQPWQKDLYSSYAQHPRADLIQRDASTALSDAQRAYNNGQYEIALDAFTQYLSQQPGDTEVLLYQGICYLELDRTDEAKQNFRQVFSANPPFSATGAWYMGLTFLKESERDSSSWFLQQVGESSEYYDQANDLLARLSR